MSRGEGADAAGMLKDVPGPLRGMLPEVYEALREILGAALEALGRGDPEGARRAAHDLKGAAMRFGLGPLALEAARAEEFAESGDEAGSEGALRNFSAVLALLEAL